MTGINEEFDECTILCHVLSVMCGRMDLKGDIWSLSFFWVISLNISTLKTALSCAFSNDKCAICNSIMPRFLCLLCENGFQGWHTSILSCSNHFSWCVLSKLPEDVPSVLISVHFAVWWCHVFCGRWGRVDLQGDTAHLYHASETFQLTCAFKVALSCAFIPTSVPFAIQ